MSFAAMVAMQNARRRRDERGRYMEDEQDGPQMNERYGAYNAERQNNERGNNQYTRERRDNYEGAQNRERRGEYEGGAQNRDRPDMRRRSEMNSRQEMNDEEDESEMKGAGYVVWDNMNQFPGVYPPIRSDKEAENITDMRTYGRRFSPQSNAGGEKPRQIGFQQSGHHQEDGKHLTREKAEKWVQGMRSGDHRGGKWKFDEIKQYASNYGVTGEQKVIDFFAVMNAMYSDYHKVAKKFGVDKTDFYAELAKAFIDDEDAVDGKAAMYYECIAGGKEEDDE